MLNFFGFSSTETFFYESYSESAEDSGEYTQLRAFYNSSYTLTYTRTFRYLTPTTVETTGYTISAGSIVPVTTIVLSTQMVMTNSSVLTVLTMRDALKDQLFLNEQSRTVFIAGDWLLPMSTLDVTTATLTANTRTTAIGPTSATSVATVDANNVSNDWFFTITGNAPNTFTHLQDVISDETTTITPRVIEKV